MISERSNIHVSYSVPIVNEGYTEVIKETLGGQTKSRGLKVSGILIEAGVSRNKIRYLPEELQKAAASWMGKPIITDHRAEVRNIVGTIEGTTYDKKTNQVLFNGVVMDPQIQEMIGDGRIKSVSAGAGVENLVEETVDGEVAQTARGLGGDEMSFVVVPGVRAASLTQALLERYEKVIRVAEQKVTEDEKDDEIARLKAEIEKMKAAKADKGESAPKTDFTGFEKKLDEVLKANDELRKTNETLAKQFAEKTTARTPPSTTETKETAKHNYVYENKSFYVKPGKHGELQLAE